MTTATATPPKEKATKEPKVFKVSEDRLVPIDIRNILSNSQNPRESAPILIGLGYGIFAKLEGSDKPSLVSIGLSENPEDRANYCNLIEKHEPAVAELAQDIIVNGQLQNARVRIRPDGGYDLVIGCRRALAVLYNSIKLNIPPRLRSVVTEVENDNKAMYMAFSENAHRMNLSPIEQGRWFKQLQNAGMEVKEIAATTKIDHQVVRQRMQLLKLPQDVQDKVHENELGVVKALEMVRGKRDTKGKGNTGKGSRGDGSRRRVPSLTEFQKLYEEGDDLHEEVRKWIAKKILEIEYVTYKKLTEMKAAQAEEAKKAG